MHILNDTHLRILKESAVSFALVCSLNAVAQAEMYLIVNPAEKINNPADKMYNPAADVKNPAANIYNPANRMNDPDPLSPPVQVNLPPKVVEAPPPTAPIKQLPEQQPPPKPVIPPRYYNFKTAAAYVAAAKKAFSRDDYPEFIAITEDALRRIHDGALKVSATTKQKLTRYKTFGYGLLDTNE